MEAIKGKLIFCNAGGYTGVYLDWKRRKWVARIGSKGENITSVPNSNRQDAVRARQRGKEMYDDFLEWCCANHSTPAAPSPAEQSISGNQGMDNGGK